MNGNATGAMRGWRGGARLVAALALLVFFAWGARAAEPQPVVFVGPAEVARLRRNAASGREPFAIAWANTLARANTALVNQKPPYLGNDPIQFRYEGLFAAGQIRDLMMAHLVTGQQKYADRARTLLMNWAGSTTMPGTTLDNNLTEMGLNVGIMATYFANGYALVHPFLSDADRASVRKWFLYLSTRIIDGHRDWIDHKYYWEQNFNNHLGGHIMGLAAIGYALGDPALIAYALDSPDNPRDFKEMHDGTILMPGKPDGEQLYRGDPTLTRGAPASQAGEIYDRYRILTIRDGQGCGLPYAMYHQKMLTLVAEMAYQHGIDYYRRVGAHGENLRTTYEFYAPFLVTGDPTVQGGYYANNPVPLGSVHMYELANLRYPNTRAIREVLARCPRVVFDSENFGYVSVLIYGEPIEASTRLGPDAWAPARR